MTNFSDLLKYLWEDGPAGTAFVQNANWVAREKLKYAIARGYSHVFFTPVMGYRVQTATGVYLLSAKVGYTGSAGEATFAHACVVELGDGKQVTIDKSVLLYTEAFMGVRVMREARGNSQYQLIRAMFSAPGGLLSVTIREKWLRVHQTNSHHYGSGVRP